MKNKKAYLIKYSLNKKIKTKWFKAVNILLAIVIISLLNIDRIINFFGGDFDNTTKIIVVDETQSYDLFKTNFESISQTLKDLGKYEVKQSEKSVKKLTKNLDKETIIINIKASASEYLISTIYSYNPLNTIDQQLITSTLNTTKTQIVMANSTLSKEEIKALTSSMEIKTNTTNPNLTENSESKDLVSSGIITVFVVPCFILIVTLVQMIGAEINDEKSTRGMEIIISSVPVKVHFFSKIFASLKFVLIQVGLLLLYAASGYLIRIILMKTAGKVVISDGLIEMINSVLDLMKNSGVLSSMVVALPIIILLIIFSFIVYSILASVLASMTTSIEDYQQLQTPLMLIMAAGYYLALMAAVFNGAVFIKILSFVPLISFLIAPAIYLLGQTTVIELLISTIICGLFSVIIYKYGLKIYKVGILNYSSSDLWKKMFKSLKEK